MRYLLLAIGPVVTAIESWHPYWVEADTEYEAEKMAKEIAFSIYSNSKFPIERFQFEFFRMDHILPTMFSRRWREEFASLNQIPKSEESDVNYPVDDADGAAGPRSNRQS
jgi:hypothetical protein